MPRPAAVYWKDLVALNRGEVLVNLGLSAPWLVMSLVAVHHQFFLLAAACSVAFFMTCLRQAHDCYHGSIGVSRRWQDAVMLALSIGMLCSTHAIRHTHLLHQLDPLGKNDAEGQWARQPAWRALVLGLLFSIRTHSQAISTGNSNTRRWVGGELILIGCICLTALWSQQLWLSYHVTAMIACNALVGFFAVWTVHHDCAPSGIFARTERRAWCNRLTVNLLYHVEHHLYPAVPANHLPALAQRLDAAAPEWTAMRVLKKQLNAA